MCVCVWEGEQGKLTEDFERSGGISNPRGTSCDLAVEDELVGRLNLGDEQSQILPDGDAAAQGSSIITFALSTMRSESDARPGSMLLFLHTISKRINQRWDCIQSGLQLSKYI